MPKRKDTRHQQQPPSLDISERAIGSATRVFVVLVVLVLSIAVVGAYLHA